MAYKDFKKGQIDDLVIKSTCYADDDHNISTTSKEYAYMGKNLHDI